MTSMLEPSNEAETAAMVLEAGRLSMPLEIVGGGTRPVGGRPAGTRALLSTARLSGVTLYEPASLTVSVRPGTLVSELEELLALEGQHLPFEPADWRHVLSTTGHSTVGGMVAAAAAGPRRIQAGSVRDSAIGVRFVDGSGTIVKNGGRVMKNVTGYDLVKLMCGSFGTLGVLSEITFKVLPKPQTAATVVLAGLSVERAVSALSAALTSQFDVNGAAHYGAGEAARSVIRVEGFEASTVYRAGQLKSLLASFGDPEIVTSGSENSRIWRQVRDVEAFKARQGAVWKISLRPSRAPSLVSAIAALPNSEYLLDWGGGLAWVLVPQAAEDGAAAIRGAVARLGGHATLMRPSGLAGTPEPAFQPQSEVAERLSKDLRRQFDPLSIFNRSRMHPVSAVSGG